MTLIFPILKILTGIPPFPVVRSTRTQKGAFTVKLLSPKPTGNSAVASSSLDSLISNSTWILDLWYTCMGLLSSFNGAITSGYRGVASECEYPRRIAAETPRKVPKKRALVVAPKPQTTFEFFVRTLISSHSDVIDQYPARMRWFNGCSDASLKGLVAIADVVDISLGIQIRQR